MRQHADSNQITEFIVRQGPVTARWDAGGDSCICYFDNDEAMKENAHVLDVLRERIIDKLNLPGVGEEYDKGHGSVYIANGNTVVITYSSRRMWYGDYETTSVELVVDDPLNLRHYLGRATIDFYAYSREPSESETERKIEGHPYITVINGEPLPYDDDALKSYLDIPKELVAKALALPIPDQTEREGAINELNSIEVSGKLTRENTITFQIERSFNICQYAENKTEPLT